MASPAEFETTGSEVCTATDGLAHPVKSSRAQIVSAVTILTFIVAVIGYVRDATLAARFGVGATMDAYFGAIFIPTNIYLILVAGTVSPVLIPVLLHGYSDDRKRTSEVFSVVTNFVLLLFAIVVVCGMVTAHQWLAWLFPGFSPATRAMSLRLIYVIFPALPLLALAGILTATLNGFHKYSLAAFAPALASIAVILTALLAHGARAIYMVAFGTSIGFLAQFLLLVPAVRSLGLHYQPILWLRHPAVVHLVRLGTPLLLYLLVANASLIIERNLASRLSAGALSYITYAMRLFSVPSNFLAAPLVIVAYPYLAREALRPGYGELQNELARALRYIVFVFAPVSVWLIVNAVPVTRVLYERGRFVASDTHIVAHVFQLYAIGVLPNAITILLLRCFYALEDTFTPLWAEGIDLLFFVVCAPVLTRRFGISGLALARGIAFILVGSILTIVLWRGRRLLRINWDLCTFMLQTVLATAVMAVASLALTQLFRSSFERGGIVWRGEIISLQIFFDGTIFLCIAFLLKMPQARRVLRAGVELFHDASGLIYRR